MHDGRTRRGTGLVMHAPVKLHTGQVQGDETKEKKGGSHSGTKPNKASPATANSDVGL